MKKQAIRISTFTLGLTVLTACGGEEVKKDSPIKDSPKTEIIADDNTSFNSQDYDFAIPSPIALFTTFKEAGMTFHPERTNPVSNAEGYTSKSQQLINFGVYSADLTYCVILDKQQETRDYFSTLESLANKFGMGSVFSDEEIAQSFEENLGNTEELENLLFDIHDKSQEYLDDNDMRFLAAVQFSGAWIEGMYLGSADFGDGDINTLRYRVAEQMTLLDNCIRGLDAYPDKDETLTAFKDKLVELQSAYNALASVKATEGVGLPKLTMDEINILKTKVEEVRNSIV